MRFLILALVLIGSAAHAQFFSPGCRPYTTCTLTRVNFPATNGVPIMCTSNGSTPSWGWALGAGQFALTRDASTTTCTTNADVLNFNDSTLRTTFGYTVALSQSAATPTALTTSVLNLLQVENLNRRIWTKDSLDSALSDLAAGPHPVLEFGLLSSRVGAGMTACPLVAQNVPNAATGVAVVNACTAVAAPTSAQGSTGRYFRMSTTLGVINSTDTVSTLVFAQASQGLRHCTAVLTPATITTMRAWVGLFTALPGSSDGPVADYFGFRYSTNAGDTAWQICSADGATSSCVTTGVAVSANTEYILCADRRLTSGGIYAQVVTAASGNPTFVAKTTNLPNATVNLLYGHSVEALAGSARSFGLASYSVEQR